MNALTWRKSSHSGEEWSDCVEVAWQRSSHSGEGGSTCVEVAATTPGILVRDSKNPAGAVIAFPPGKWRAFLADQR
ncbi:DUF397 domain-containing protein [Saccharothrix violaceirubra]|uniref:DUF397 domain-containing protein n=1 Tax=Saccharothrix violaceirubra TaxID=413306 RepID=UPI00160C910F|nr:DUF397 domain-containing protein [Saccharothrix violaceirubra]